MSFCLPVKPTYRKGFSILKEIRDSRQAPPCLSHRHYYHYYYIASVVSDSVTPQTAAHQAPPPLGFSRQEPWSGLPFPSPMHESEK